MSDQRPIRVIVVDDHPMFRLGLTASIAEMNGIEVVGEAACGEDLPALLDENPDVVLLDIGLPGISGIELVRWLTEHHPAVRVLMLTMSDDFDTALAALRDGPRGYLVKGANGERLEQAIRTVATGDVVLDHGLVDGVGELRDGPADGRYVARVFPALTDRELEVLELIAQGCNNTEIARKLVVNPKTVRNHITNIFAKLHLPDRSAAIVLAHKHGVGA